MRRLLAVVVSAVFLAGLAPSVLAQDAVLKGELVDSHCFMKDKKNAGAGHRDCAMTCAKKGTPVALVTSDGVLYIVTGDLTKDSNAQLVPHLSHTVELSGVVSDQDGKKSIAAKSLKMAS